MKTFQEHLDIALDEALIAELETGKDICSIPIHKLRSPVMKKVHKDKCSSKKKEKDSPMRKAAKHAGLSRSARDKLYNAFDQAYKDNLKESASGFDKDVHPSYYEKFPQYTGGGWFTDVIKFNDYLMDPTSYYHKRAVRSPQHPITGKKELQFKMKDKRMGEPAFARLYKKAINAPMDRELVALVKASKLRKKV